MLDAVGVAADGPFAGTSLKDVVRAGRGDDRPAYFESMTYNLVRGWAPLRGVLVQREKYIDLPIPELYDLAGDPKEERNLAPQQRRAACRCSSTCCARSTSRRPTGPARNRPRSRRRCARSATCRAARPSARSSPRPTIRRTSSCVDRDLHTASELYQSGKVQEAIALLNSVIARRPDTADAYISLAHAYWESGQLQLAIATLEKALTNGAPDRDVRIRLGIYLAESQTDPAPRHQAARRPAGERRRSAQRPRRGLRRRRPLCGRHSGVQEGAGARSDQRPRVPEPRVDGAAGRRWRRRARAIGRAGCRKPKRYARQALDTDPSLPKAYTTLGVVLAESGRKSEAIDSWKRAVALDGREFDALYNLTVLLLEAQRLDDARAYAKQFVATAPPALYGPAIEQMRKFLGG